MAQALAYRQRAHDAAMLLDEFERMNERGEPFSAKDLAVNGRDAIDRGVPEGPLIGGDAEAPPRGSGRRLAEKREDALLARLDELARRD